MTTQTLSVPRPRFAKSSWLILPAIGYALLCWLSFHDSYVGVLIGPLMDAPTQNANGDPLATKCEYLRLNAASVALVEVVESVDGCSIVRIFSEHEGRLLELGRKADLHSEPGKVLI